MADGAGGVEALGAYRHAVLDAVAAKHAEGIVQFRQALLGGGIAAARQKAVGLEQARGTDELVGVPPKGRAAGGAAGAEDALVQTVQLGPLLRRLEPL